MNGALLPSGARRRVGLVGGGFLAAAYFFSVAGDRGLTGWAVPAAVACGVLLAGGAWISFQRPDLPFGVAAVTLGSLGMGWVAPHSAGGAAIFLAVGLMGRRYSFRSGLLPAAAAGLAALLVLELRSPPKDLNSLAATVAGLVLTYAGTQAARRSRAEQEAAREAQFEAARAEERTRLAREMHDVLAHSLSALAIQLDLARTLLRRGESVDAEAAVERAHGLARQGLEEARRAVGALRGDATPGPGDLARLAEQFRADTGAECELALADGLPELSAEERVALYRVAQEALTNVRKHALAHRVRVGLAASGRGVELTVENDGGRRAGAAGGGYGLTGMRERAELLGGRLEAAPTEDGFRVRLWLPA